MSQAPGSAGGLLHGRAVTVPDTAEVPPGGYDALVTRFRPTAAALAALTTWLLAAPAFAQAGPPLAPPPAVPAPSALDFAIDALLPSAASYLALRFVVGGTAPRPDPTTGVASGAVGLFTGGVMLAGLAAPPIALVAYRERPFALDMALASFAGGLAGLGIGYGAARLASGGAAAPDLLALSMALGQGLGAASAYHLYRLNKADAKDLNRLPAQRKDDPIDDWKLWRERRTP